MIGQPTRLSASSAVLRTTALAIVLIVVSVTASKAQSSLFRGRVVAGMCAAQVHGDGISGFNKLGATAGVGVEMRRGDKVWTWDILYTQKGSRRVPNPKAGDYNTWRYRFTYIDLPVMREWHLLSGWWVGVGVQPSLLIAGEEDFYQNGFTELSYVELRPWDLGGVVSGGVMWGDQWGIEARLGQSLLPISEQPEQPVVRFDNFMMNMTIQLAARWQFAGG